MESFIESLRTLDPSLVCLSLFAIAFVENIFPPAPSDMAVVFGGTLIGIGGVGFVPAVLSATAGSTLGFVAMYIIGKELGRHLLKTGRIRFLPVASVHRVEGWFRKYGYGIIIANRFLAGTRAVVSFFAGMSELNLTLTTVLCFASALVWNTILLSAGYMLGNNWQRIGFYISTYSQIVTALVIILVLVLAARYLAKSKKESA